MTETYNKHWQMQDYRNIVAKKLTDKKLKAEIKSFRKHLQSCHDMYQWGNLNPNDINNADRLLVLIEELKERGLEE